MSGAFIIRLQLQITRLIMGMISGRWIRLVDHGGWPRQGGILWKMGTARIAHSKCLYQIILVSLFRTYITRNHSINIMKPQFIIKGRDKRQIIGYVADFYGRYLFDVIQFIIIFNQMRKTLVRLQQYAFSGNSIWATAELHKPEYGRHQDVTLIPGIGIGPQITNSVVEVFQAANVPVNFDIIKDFTFQDLKQRDALHKNKCILLGVMVPQKGVKAKYNDNHKFYKHLDLFANVNLCFSHPSIATRHSNVDIAVIRENTEGEFTGIEHEVYPGVMESLKVTTKANSLRLIQYAFEFAHFSGRKKVSVIHKANIMKLVDGLFLEQARIVAKKYPFIKYEEMIVDNCAMQLVKTPSQFDVMVAPNLYGSIISHIAAGITGGVGMTPGACIGNNYALFSQGMPHSGLSISGKNIANPTSILLSSIMMLRYLGLPMFANKISKAVSKTLQAGKVKTADIGGHNTTTQFTKEVIVNLA